MSEPLTFSYEALDARGRRRKGKVVAADRHEAVASLQADGFVPVEVTPFVRTAGNIEVFPSRNDRPLVLKPPQKVAFARQLYLLVRAGLSLPRALEVIGDDGGDVRYVRMCNTLATQVLSGVPLSRAMEEFPGCFDEVFRSYVAAGEASGSLEQSLERLSHMLNKANQLRLKVKGVTAYPKLVSAMIAVLVAGIMVFLVPMFASIYDGFGAELPAPTRALIFLSEVAVPVRVSLSLSPPFVSLADTGFWFSASPPFVTSAGPNLLSSPINFFSPVTWGVAAWFGWRRFRRARADDLELGARLNQLKFRAPVLGKLWKYTALYRWSSTMAGALAAGLQLHEALGLAARASGSGWLLLVTEDLQAAVRAGRPLSRELGRHPDLFSPQLRAMAATGEESGEPAEMFGSVAATLEDELDAMVAVLGARIEVVLLAVMGVVVGSLLLVLYLPILNLSSVATEGLSTPPSGP